ncbi:MAG: PAS domain S-box protein [Spirochaetales bacterium]|nr:PAS domain S-box protein [Spirochaetales bacterium]
MSGLVSLNKELEEVFSKIPIAIYILDKNYSISFVNDKARSLSRLIQGNVIGQQLGDILRCINALNSPNGCGTTEKCRSCKIRETIKTTIQNKTDITGIEAQMESVSPEGRRETVWIKISTGLLNRNEEGIIIISLEDITSQKEKERLLKASEKMSRALIEANSDAVSLVDRNGMFLTMNENLLNRLGKSREELTGTNMFDFLPPDLAISRRDILDEVLKSGKPCRQEDRQDSLVLDNNVYPILDDSGNVSMVAIFSRDITKEKSTELAMRLSEEKYKFIANKTADVIYRIDLLTERYIYASPSAHPILGYSQEECLKLHSRDILTNESYDIQKKNLEAAFHERRRDPILMELELVRKDGRIITGEINACLIYNDIGSPVEILGSVRDISRRKESEREKDKVIKELKEALQEIKALNELIPICARCKKIRDDQGYWENLEAYFEKKANTQFSHGICPECARDLYGNEDWFKKIGK